MLIVFNLRIYTKDVKLISVQRKEHHNNRNNYKSTLCFSVKRHIYVVKIFSHKMWITLIFTITLNLRKTSEFSGNYSLTTVMNETQWTCSDDIGSTVETKQIKNFQHWPGSGFTVISVHGWCEFFNKLWTKTIWTFVFPACPCCHADVIFCS